MGSKICPICDGKVNSINFCKTCKRFVTPIETSHTFYLNERREPKIIRESINIVGMYRTTVRTNLKLRMK